MSFVDSGAGQSMVAANAAFIPATLQAVRIAIEGVTGTMMVHFLGTAELYVLDYDGTGVILQIPNCLMNPGQHNLLSLAQLQMHPDIAVNMTNEAPMKLFIMTVGMSFPWCWIMAPLCCRFKFWTGKILDGDHCPSCKLLCLDSTCHHLQFRRMEL